jgi:hypothetical protein
MFRTPAINSRIATKSALPPPFIVKLLSLPGLQPEHWPLLHVSPNAHRLLRLPAFAHPSTGPVRGPAFLIDLCDFPEAALHRTRDPERS